MIRTAIMFAKLTTNRGKKFKRVSDGLIISKDEKGYFRWDSGYAHINENDDWQEVKEPLTFRELLEELKKLHNINLEVRVVYEKLDLDRTEHFRGLMSWMFSTMLVGEIADVLLNAKFYVEED